MEYRNFSISRGKGKLYLKAKQPTEGYEEITYGEGKKTYHQYHKSIEGIPKEFGVKEVEYEGRTLKFLELSLEDGEIVNKVSVNLKNKGGYTDESKALFSALRDLEVNQRVSLSPVRSTSEGKNGKTYENLNIYVNYLDKEKGEDGKSPTTGYIHFNDIPKPEKKEVAGDVVWDFTPQTEFYYKVFQEISSKFDGVSSEPQQNAPSQQSEKKEAPKQEAKQPQGAKPEDDLPF